MKILEIKIQNFVEKFFGLKMSEKYSQKLARQRLTRQRLTRQRLTRQRLTRQRLTHISSFEHTQNVSIFGERLYNR